MANLSCRNICLKLSTIGLEFFSLLVIALGGCSAAKPTAEQLDRGLVYMFPGIEGGEWVMAEARRGYRDGKVESAIVTYNWNRPPVLGALVNLMDEKGNRKAAKKTAQEITQYQNAHPDAPIDLVGYSGGGGMAIMVAEALDPSIQVRNIVLVQAAISPDYNLTQTLQRVNGRLVNFYSPNDWFVLGLGTRLFGTMDREFTESAGKVGFDLDKAVVDLELRKKVIQHSWTLKILKESHHLGNHFSLAFYKWNRDRRHHLRLVPGVSSRPHGPDRISPPRIE